MEKKELLKYLSAPRANRYLKACEGNPDKAISLYNLNLKLSCSLFAIFNFFEVAFRNSVNNTMVQLLGKDWIVNAFSTGIFKSDFSSMRDMLGKLKRNSDEKKKTNDRDAEVNNDDLVGNSSFGFWCDMFDSGKSKALYRALLIALATHYEEARENGDYSDYIALINKEFDNVEDKIWWIAQYYGRKNMLLNAFNSKISNEINHFIIKYYQAGTDSVSSRNIDTIISTVDSINVVAKELKSEEKMLDPAYIRANIGIMLKRGRVNKQSAINLQKALTKPVFGVYNYWVRRVFSNIPETIDDKAIDIQFITEQLRSIRNIRNRIAHHDPICFMGNRINTNYVITEFDRIVKMFTWLGIDISLVDDDCEKIVEIIERINNL